MALARHMAKIERWIDSCVIGAKLCPFAKAVRVRPHAMRVVLATDAQCKSPDLLMAACKSEIDIILKGPDPRPETTVFGVPDATLMREFAEFLDMSVLVEEVIADASEGQLQLAIFHPKANAELMMYSKPVAAMMARDVDPSFVEAVDDPANYAIRSPMPIFHLLRTADVVNAVTAYGPAKANDIPDRNRDRLRAMSAEELNKLFGFISE
eukprot:m.100823 g.100823  ORF g.100823 m.100823 type:complete len:210 (+) comp27276_c3_seq1:325-954(+)